MESRELGLEATLAQRLRPRERAPWHALVRFAGSKPLGAAGGIVIVVLVLVALLAGVLAPYDPIFTKA
ncbi:MAG: hypothetical protein HY689_09970, partial [Chloroflexi bacterium]|nr:hypothetical protein [Chloroflexota bacterium]